MSNVELAGGASTFTGPVSVNGNLTLGAGDSFGAAANTVTFTGGSLVTFNNIANIAARPFIISGAGGLAFVPGNVASTIGASISGPGPVRFTGIGLGSGGIITLTGTNTFTGGLLVGLQTTVRFSTDAQLGEAGEPITLSGGSLAVLASGTLSNARVITVSSTNGSISAPAGVTLIVPNNLAGAGLEAASDAQFGGASGALHIGRPNGLFPIPGMLRALGNLSLAATRTTTFQNATVDTNGFDVTFNQPITGSHLTKEGAGVLRLNTKNANDNSHDVRLNVGTLRLGANDALGLGARVTLAAGAVFHLNGFHHEVARIGGDGDIQLGTGTLTMRQGLVLGGVISGTGAVVVKSGAVPFFNGANTWSGGLTVTGGARVLAGSTSALGVPGNPITLDNGGLGVSTLTPAPLVIDAATNLTIAAGGAIFSSEGQTLVIAAQLTGSAGGRGRTLPRARLHAPGATTFLVLANDDAEAINTAAGANLFAFGGNALSEGETFSAAGFDWTLPYTGGTGNDVTLTVVPEPSSAALLAATGALLGLRRRRR